MGWVLRMGRLVLRTLVESGRTCSGTPPCRMLVVRVRHPTAANALYFAPRGGDLIHCRRVRARRKFSFLFA
jgi:hypothetical protein